MNPSSIHLPFSTTYPAGWPTLEQIDANHLALAEEFTEVTLTLGSGSKVTKRYNDLLAANREQFRQVLFSQIRQNYIEKARILCRADEQEPFLNDDERESVTYGSSDPEFLYKLWADKEELSFATNLLTKYAAALNAEVRQDDEGDDYTLVIAAGRDANSPVASERAKTAILAVVTLP